MLEYNTRREIVLFGKLLYERGLMIGTDGNISARLSEGHILITPSGTRKGALTPEGILKVSLEGKVIEPEGFPSVELPFHLAIYQALPEVNAIVHSHPPYATTFAAREEIPDAPLVEAELLPKISLVPYALPGSSKLANAIVQHYSAVSGPLNLYRST